MNTKDQELERLIVYRGVYGVDGSRRFVYSFLPVDCGTNPALLLREDIERAPRYYQQKPIAQNISPGGVLAVWTRGSDQYRYKMRCSSIRYVGMLNDEPLVAAWALRSATVEMRLNGVEGAKKYAPIMPGLSPIRDIYRRAYGENKALLIAAVVEFITRSEG